MAEQTNRGPPIEKHMNTEFKEKDCIVKCRKSTTITLHTQGEMCVFLWEQSTNVK